MNKKTIPNEVKENALQTIERFNLRELAKTGFCYVARFQGKYLYLDRDDCGNVGPICRLEYKGNGKPEALPSTNTAPTVTTPRNVGFLVLNSPMEQLRAH